MNRQESTTLKGWGQKFISAMACAAVLGGVSITASASTTAKASEVAPSQITLQAPSDKVKNSKLEFIGSMDGFLLRDEFVKSNNFSLGLGLVGNRKFGKIFDAQLDVLAYYTKGNAASLYTSEGDPGTGAILFKAAIVAEPTDWFEIRGGVLPTNFNTIKSVFRTSGFLGVSEKITLGDSEEDGISFAVMSAQTVPTASGRERAPGSESKTPLLVTSGAELTLESERIEFKVGGSHFKFSDLPSNLASSSALYGNTVFGIGSEVTEFAYEFEGYQGSSSLELDLSGSLEVKLSGAYLKNIKAPAGLNEGYSTAVSVEYDVNKNLEITPEVAYVYNERDILPSSYITRSVGKNNRKALSMKLTVEMPEDSMKFFGRYVRTLEIVDLPFQADRDIFSFGLEASYDIL